MLFVVVVLEVPFEDTAPDALELIHVAGPLIVHAALGSGVGIGVGLAVGVGVGVGLVLSACFKAPPIRLIEYFGGFVRSLGTPSTCFCLVGAISFAVAGFSGNPLGQLTQPLFV